MGPSINRTLDAFAFRTGRKGKRRKDESSQKKVTSSTQHDKAETKTPTLQQLTITRREKTTAPSAIMPHQKTIPTRTALARARVAQPLRVSRPPVAASQRMVTTQALAYTPKRTRRSLVLILRLIAKLS